MSEVPTRIVNFPGCAKAGAVVLTSYGLGIKVRGAQRALISGYVIVDPGDMPNPLPEGWRYRQGPDDLGRYELEVRQSIRILGGNC